MSYSAYKYQRRESLLMSVAEQNAILSSDTPTARTQAGSSAVNPWYHSIGADGSWDEEYKYTDLMAMVVLEDVPHETINEVLRINAEETGEPYLWLADTHDSIPDYDPQDPSAQGTIGPIDSNWRSPFIGCTVEEVAAFIQATPKPPKSLGKRFFAVLQKDLYEQSKQLLIYKILDAEDDDSAKLTVQSVPCPAHLVGYFFMSYDRYFWDKAVKYQGLFYGHGYHWDEDDSDLTALIVLDEFPIETLNKIIQDNGGQDSRLWLADTYENLPDVRAGHTLESNTVPIDSGWRSPFLGKSIQDAANLVRNAPKPPKPLAKTFFIVMQKELFENSDSLLICKILPVGGEVGLSENEQSRTEEFRADGMSLMCKIESDKQQNADEDKVDGEDAGEFELQMMEYDAGGVGDWLGADDSDYWWLN